MVLRTAGPRTIRAYPPIVMLIAPAKAAASVLALIMLLAVVSAASADPARVHGSRILDGAGHPLALRGISWGGARFIPAAADQPLAPIDIADAERAFNQIRRLGGNAVRVDVSSALNSDQGRLALQQLQVLTRTRKLVLLIANVPLSDTDQTAWLQTIASWLEGKENVWYLPEVDPGCSLLQTGTTCDDATSWASSQGRNIDALRGAGVETPIVVNLPDSSQTVTRQLAARLDRRNVIFAIHPQPGQSPQFTSADGRALTATLATVATQVPVVFDDLARVSTVVDRSTASTPGGAAAALTRDRLLWAQGLQDWLTGWVVAGPGDGAVISGWDSGTRDDLSRGRGLSAWGSAVASGYLAVGFRAASGHNPRSGFLGAFQTGDHGVGVRRLQRALQDLGILDGQYVNGLYGDATWQAVVGFQGYSGLERTGLATAELVAQILSAKPPTSQRGGPAHVEVDITRQVLLLVDTGGRVVRTIHVSTGATDNTPDGEFRVFSKELMSWDYAFHFYLPYASYFHGGFAMHEFPSVPEYPASHGCVRIAWSNAKAVYDFAGYGMSIFLYHS